MSNLTCDVLSVKQGWSDECLADVHWLVSDENIYNFLGA